MVQFVTDKPVRSKVPEVAVENPLKPGTYRFSLVVIDDSDNESEPFDLAVTVVEQTRTTVLRPELIREATVLRQPVGINPRLRVIRPQ
jgi:hypothetical protein